MINYANAKIYTIRNYTDNEMIYVGSTTQTLSRRLAEHRVKCKAGKSCSLYSHIFDDDWSNWYIELHEYYPCNNKTELDRKEGEMIRQIGTINKKIEGRTRKEYYNDNIDKIKEYYKENADKIKEQHKEYYESNKEKYKEKVCCNICNTFITKINLARHQLTPKCTGAVNKII